MDSRQNNRVWARGDYVDHYATRSLRPPEVILFLRHAEELAGRVLELGCGAGRITGYLGARGGDVLGIDISSAMVSFCQKRYPELAFAVGDVSDLGGFESESRDVIVAEFNILGVLNHAERGHAFRELNRILVDGGLLLFSSHNHGHMPNVAQPAGLVTRSRNPARVAWNLARLPRRMVNRRRLEPFEHRGDDYAIVNDEAHDFRLLHYYIGRDVQEAQLNHAGFDLLECLDGSGASVGRGALAAEYPELHYAARSHKRRG